MQFVEIDAFMMRYFLFGLVLIRSSALVVSVPFFGAEQFPTTVRVAMALFFAVVMAPFASQTAVLPETLGYAELFYLAAQEFVLGLVIGFLCTLVFMGIQLAGGLVGTQIGFAMANVVDPMTEDQVSLIGFFKMNLALVLFVMLKLHLVVLLVLYKSFGWIGIGTLVFRQMAPVLNEAMLMQMQWMFEVALRLSMPILVVMLLESVIEGFVTRTMPQMNIMVLGLPLRVTLGLTVFMLAIPTLVNAMAEILEITMGQQMMEIVEALPGTRG